jgi:hypothetical protein
MGLEGKWYNKLGSVMELQVHGSSVSGIFRTAVGEAQGDYLLAGAADTEALHQSQAIGFVVAWVNEKGSSHSVTAWSGQLQTIDAQEVLITTWLLTYETEPNQDWKSTLVGTDRFTREPPTRVDVEKAARQHVWSHPARVKTEKA